ncbi:MAG: carboxypeptidase regulatory-like domain-containing protein [Planctomycetes bacterium]|nr:carboxypeptidase regulatory-like domain-containing protein [Planctomycetota bacterium]
MRKLIPITVVLALLFGALVWWASGRPEARPDLSREVVHGVGDRQVELHAVPQAETSAASLRSEAVVPEAAGVATARTRTGPRSRIFGRVVDDSGTPLAGARLRLSSSQGRWSSREELESTRSQDGRSGELVASSATDGTFAFEAPVPTTAFATLVVEPPGLYRRLEVEFGMMSLTRERIEPGDNDLGDLRVLAGAELFGFVVGPAGTPIANASVMAQIVEGEPRAVPVRTDASGFFTIPNLKAGPRLLSIDAEGHTRVDQLPVDAPTGRSTEVPAVVLQPLGGSTISGIVVDSDGNAVPRISVRAQPLNSPTRRFAMTEADGTFRVYLEFATAHTLSVAGTDAWAGPADPTFSTLQFAPGTTGVRIVLAPKARMTFRVTEAMSGAPIERFGIEVRKRRPGAADIPPSDDLVIADHAGVNAQLPAEPGTTQVTVDAPGFAPCEIDVALDPGSADTQTIALAPEGVLKARVWIGGQPAESVRATLMRESLSTKDGRAVGTPGGYSSEAVNDLRGYLGRSRVGFTAEDGAIRFDRLATGTYALALEQRDAAYTWVRELRVSAGQTLELGDVHLALGGIVRGRLLVPEGESPLDFIVRLHPPHARSQTANVGRSRQTVPSGADGRFEFRALEPGTFYAVWERNTEQRGFVFGAPAPELPRVDVIPGGVHEILLDATGSAPCTVAVRVFKGGLPLAGARVQVVVQRSSQPNVRSGSKLAVTDADGRGEGTVEGGARIQLLVHETDKGALVWESEEDIAAPPRGRIEREIHIDSGTLVLQLPASLVPPEEGLLNVSLQHESGSMRPLMFRTPGKTGSRGGLIWDSSTLDLGTVGVGKYTVRVQFTRLESELDQPDRFKSVELRPTFRGEVEILSNQTARLVVP